MTTLQTPLAIVSTVTTAGALAAGKHTPVDATSAPLTVTLPTPVTVGARLRVEKTDATANAVTISGTLRGSAGTIVLTSQFHTVEFFAETLASWRVAADHRTKAALDAAYGRAAPTLSNFSYDATTGNLLSYQEDGITITLTYNSDGTVATSKRGSDPVQTYTYSGGNLVGVA